MFTGLIEEVGSIKNIQHDSQGFTLEVTAHKVLTDAFLGASIAVNGVCLTVKTIQEHSFSFLYDQMMHASHPQ